MTDPHEEPASDTSPADPLAWTTLDSAVDYACPGFDVRRDEVVLPDGTQTDYHYVDEPPAVVVLPFTPDGEVVVIEEWRQAVRRVNRGLPAGTAETADDSLAETARRELAEETGHEARSVERFLTVEPANGVADIEHHYFRAVDCEPTAEQRLDHNESIRVATAAYDDLLAAAVDGDLRDGRAVTALLHHELTER
ncbi:MAG: NUDIX hydrolase [Haloferacaceae archaeon]